MSNELPIVQTYSPMQFSGMASPTIREHEWRLAKMLEIGFKPESTEGKKLTERMLGFEKMAIEARIQGMPRYLAELNVAEFKTVRELLLTEAIESTTLIQTEFYKTVLEGAEPNKIMRNAVRTIPIKSNQQSITLGETGSVLPEVAEGAELKDNSQNYTNVTLKSKKYGEKNVVSNELIEDSLFPVVALEVSKAGARAENTLNHVVLTGLLDDAGNEHDCAGSDLAYKAIAGGRKLMKKDFYNPDTCIVCADSEFVLMTDSQLSYSSYYGGGTPITSQTLPPIFGMKFYEYDPADSVYNSATYDWGYDADGDIGMILLDSSRLSHVVGIRRDITVKDYDDPIRDIKGAALTMRFAETSPFDNGICRIEY
jgi:Phage capsid family